jgi:hypothetical protein
MAPWAMLPPLSDALAVKLKVAGAVALAPLIGAVRLTTGGEFPVTVTDFAVEVAVAPKVSVATAVSE